MELEFQNSPHEGPSKQTEAGRSLDLHCELLKEEPTSTGTESVIGSEACKMTGIRAASVQDKRIRIYQRPNVPSVHTTRERMKDAVEQVREERRSDHAGLKRASEQLDRILRAQSELLPTTVSILTDKIQSSIVVRRRFAEMAVFAAVSNGQLVIDEETRQVMSPNLDSSAL